MRIFLAGASGVIGQKLVPLLVERGHVVAGMTRSAEKTALLTALGAEPVLCDVFDGAALNEAVLRFAPELVLHELTDLPDDRAALAERRAANARIRVDGTHNLLAAARAAGVGRVIAQSVAWEMPPDEGAYAVAELERSVLAERGLVLRYGQFYGPGTYHEHELPAEPRVRIDRAAAQKIDSLDAPSGIRIIVD